MDNNKNEVIVKVKAGTKARIVETNEKDLGSRDVHIDVPQNLKISVNRAQKEFNGSVSTMTMCG